MKANGDPCGLAVVPGTNRCYLHGGALPSTLIKAQLALALLRSPAVDVLFNSMISLDTLITQLQSVTCAACGFPEHSGTDEIDKLIKACFAAAKTAAAVLDRTGLGPRSTVEVKQSDGDLDMSALTHDELERMIGLLAQVRALKAEIRARLFGQTQTLNGRPIMTMPNGVQ